MNRKWIAPVLPAAVWLLTEYGIYRAAFYNSDKRKHAYYKLPESSQYDEKRNAMVDLVSSVAEVPAEEVRIHSHDGLTLFGRYYETEKGAPLQIQFHGWRGGSIRDMAGANTIARNNGQNVLLVDERAHGLSDGHTTTFGVKERYDVLSWVNYAIGRFGPDVKIVLSGVSMGGAVVLMASDLDLPPNVKGIIADSPFASPKSIICKVAEDRHIPSGCAWPFVVASARIFGHFSINEFSALEAVKKAKVPILLIHGTGDRFVPCDMSRQIAENCASPVELEIFENAPHGVSYLWDTDRYVKIETEFCRKVFAAHEEDGI